MVEVKGENRFLYLHTLDDIGHHSEKQENRPFTSSTTRKFQSESLEQVNRLMTNRLQYIRNMCKSPQHF